MQPFSSPVLLKGFSVGPNKKAAAYKSAGTNPGGVFAKEDFGCPGVDAELLGAAAGSQSALMLVMFPTSRLDEW